MAYQALYRVFRPQNFSSIVGQDVITKTLKNAVKNKRTSHAYLFCGPRGTGKTSCAKVLAKAINCLNPQDGEPCNECSICKDANENKLNDIIEIDAASNNGVEEIRDIRDKVKYAPIQAEYKVYIIDEVHMLSQGAFNALLKTLEEPPEKVVFILATTEPQKIPATIISRTQRFDFRRIGKFEIINRLKYVLNDQNIEYDEEAVNVIAKSAEGGMRDALSIMDQAISFGNNKLTLDNSLQVTGSIRNDNLLKYFDYIANKNTSEALKSLNDILSSGSSAQRLTESIISLCRDLILIKSNNSDQISQPEILNSLEQKKDLFTQDRLFNIVNIVSETQRNLKSSNQIDIYLEIMTVKASSDDSNTENSNISFNEESEFNEKINQLQIKISELENKISNFPKDTQESQKIKNGPKKSTKNNIIRSDKKSIFEVLGNATKDDLNNVRDVWPDMMQMLPVTQRAMMNVSSPVAASQSGVVVAFDYAIWFEKVNQNQELMETLKNNLYQLIKKEMNILLVEKSQWPNIRKEYIADHESELKNNEEENEVNKQKSEVVTVAQDIFGEENINIKED